MQRLVECVPNFSEGRRHDVLDAIADALRAHVHARLLDIESDADHNRSVFTLVAPPEAMVPAMFDAIKTAASLIDLEQHRGGPPSLRHRPKHPPNPPAGPAQLARPSALTSRS